jgi:hypothetical protein
VILFVAALREWLAEGCDCQSGLFQSRSVCFQRLRPAGKIHAQAIALLTSLEALPSKIVAPKNKWSIRLRTGEISSVPKRVHN